MVVGALRHRRPSASTSLTLCGGLPVILMKTEPASANIMKTYIYANSEPLAQRGAMKLATMRQE